MLSLLKNSSAYHKAQQEVDRVIGSSTIKFEHLAQLEYLQACLRESLRLYPTAPAFARQVSGEQDEIIGGGRYRIPKGVSVVCLLGAIQQDCAVYSEDATAYKPERMVGERFKDLPHDSWKVFPPILHPDRVACAF